MLEVGLRQQCHIILEDRLWEALPPIQMWCCAWEGFHHHVNTWPEEFLWTDVICVGSLNEYSEVDCCGVLTACILGYGAIDGKVKL